MYPTRDSRRDFQEEVKIAQMMLREAERMRRKALAAGWQDVAEGWAAVSGDVKDLLYDTLSQPIEE
jgi:hypothetical protein